MEDHTINALREAVRQGGQPRFLFFWGHPPRRDGTIGKTCFSQWFAAGFTLAQMHYPTAEHYMMAEKARLFGDEATLAKILKAPPRCRQEARTPSAYLRRGQVAAGTVRYRREG